jgi:hypothetical protein
MKCRTQGRKFQRMTNEKRTAGSLTVQREEIREGRLWLWCSCSCGRVDLYKVRSDNFGNPTIRCDRCQIAARWGNQRARKKKTPETHRRAKSNETTPVNLQFVTHVLELDRDTPPDSPPPRCPHSVRLASDEVATGISGSCQLCTPPIARDIQYYPPTARGQQRLTAKYERILKRENLSEHRGLSPSDDDGRPASAKSKTGDRTKPAGKNLIQVGGSADVDTANNRNVSVSLFGGKRRIAAGRDKIRAVQNPNVDYDGTSDAADSRLVSVHDPGSREFDKGIDRRTTHLPEFDAQSVGAPSTRKSTFEIVKAGDRYRVQENGVCISNHRTKREAQTALRALKAELVTDSEDDRAASGAEEREFQITEDEVDALLVDEEEESHDA